MEVNYKITELISPVLENLGYNLVKVSLLGTKRQTLQIMAERLDDETMTIEDCTKISRAISPILDVEDPISGSYALEVSSPGINRPLVKPEDYTRFKGLNAKIETNDLINNRKRFNGIITDLNSNNEVVLTLEDEIYTIPYDNIKNAKLFITNDVLKKAKKK